MIWFLKRISINKFGEQVLKLLWRRQLVNTRDQEINGGHERVNGWSSMGHEDHLTIAKWPLNHLGLQQHFIQTPWHLPFTDSSHTLSEWTMGMLENIIHYLQGKPRALTRNQLALWKRLSKPFWSFWKYANVSHLILNIFSTFVIHKWPLIYNAFLLRVWTVLPTKPILPAGGWADGILKGRDIQLLLVLWKTVGCHVHIQVKHVLAYSRNSVHWTVLLNVFWFIMGCSTKICTIPF